MDRPKMHSFVPARWVAALTIVAVAAGCEAEEEVDAAGAAAGDTAQAAPEESEPLTVEGFSTPESALFDEDAGVYLVSNINGAPLDRDGNGFISRVTPDGEVETLRWIDGESDDGDVTLNAPKGMGLSGDTLFVADIDVVRMFDRSTGEPLGERTVAGATFLNDIAVGDDGAVYVSDTGVRFTEGGMEQAGTDAVYRFGDDGAATAVAQGSELQNPNGIAIDGDEVIVVTFGGNQVYRLDADGERTEIARLPTGQLDGVVRLDDGSLLVSSWEGSAVYLVQEGEEAWAVVEDVTSPADIGFDPSRERVLIPVFEEDRLRMEPLRRQRSGSADTQRG